MDFLLVILPLAGLIWLAWFMLRGSLVGGCLAAILAGACFGYSFWHAEGGLPLTTDRLLIVLLAATYVIRRRWGQADPKPMGRADWALLMLLGALGMSTFGNDWHDHNNQPAAHLVFYWLMPALVYWIARQSPMSVGTLRTAFGTLAVFGVYLTLTALAEGSGQTWALFPTYMASSTTEYYGRARGPFLNPAEMGIYLTVCLAAALSFGPRFSRRGQMLLLGFTVLTLGGIYATLTRSAWMGGALGLAVLLAFNLPRQWRTLFLGSGALAGIVLLAASWESIWNIKRDVKLEASASVESAQLRPILAKVAWDMFRDRPLMGCGYGQYDREKMPYLSNRDTDLPLDKVIPYVQHNAFLALLAETGLVGMGLFLLLLVLWIRMASRLATDATLHPLVRQWGVLLLVVVGAYLPNAMFQDTNIIDGVNLLLFFVAGMTSGLAARKSDFRLPSACPVETSSQIRTYKGPCLAQS
jgi:O-antigen ligase